MLFPFLNHYGVLGLNARNLLYIKPFNPKKAVAFADDKMKTKAFLSARGIPTARLFARIETRRQLNAFDFASLPDECVLKPNEGFGGEGIIILKGRRNGKFLEQGKTPISEQRLREHIEDILDGKFSISGQADFAFFEQILIADDCFTPFRPAGLPDLRIVVFNLVPVMAMLRIPTAQSRGKANVHLGGIGIGVDIAKGVTTHAAQYNHILSELPHGTPVAGIQIPRWEEMLLISSRIQHITNIGYLAVDLTIDHELGPVLLEVNARAGLMVQVANLAPLRARLERVAGLKVSSPEKGVRIAQELFGEKVGRRRDDTPEKPILAPREILEIASENFMIEELCAVAPEREHTMFAPEFIAELQKLDVLEPVHGAHNVYKMKFSLGGQKIQTLVQAGETGVPDIRAVIGRRDLAGFLIDPAKRTDPTLRTTGIKQDLRAADRLLATLDRELQVLKELRPANLEEELERSRLDERYNPVFSIDTPKTDLQLMEENLRKIATDDSPLGILLRKKRRELLLKVELLRARGDALKFSAASMALYGAPSTALLGFAEAHLKSRIACDMKPRDQELLSAEETKNVFENVMMAYGLHEWQVTMKTSMIADCAVGGKKVFLRTGAMFSRSHIESLVAHEIETHVLTAENGAIQPYELFRRGFANYLDTQEGLAIYSQMRILSPHHEKRYQHAKNVFAVAYAMEHSFADTRRYLVTELGFPAEKALMKAADLKRGFSQTSEPGAFTKSLVYFRGYRAIEHFIREGGDIRRLYIGKIAIEDLSLINQISGVKEALILPTYLRTKKASKPAKAPKSRKKAK